VDRLVIKVYSLYAAFASFVLFVIVGVYAVAVMWEAVPKKEWRSY